MDSSSTDSNTPSVSYCSLCQKSNSRTDWEFLKEFFLREQNSALQIQNLKTELDKARVTISVLQDQHSEAEAALLKCREELENTRWTRFEKLKQFEDQLGQVKERIFDDEAEIELHLQDLKWENRHKQERINELECALGLQNLQQCEDEGNRVGEISPVVKVESDPISEFILYEFPG